MQEIMDSGVGGTSSALHLLPATRSPQGGQGGWSGIPVRQLLLLCVLCLQTSSGLAISSSCSELASLLACRAWTSSTCMAACKSLLLLGVLLVCCPHVLQPFRRSFAWQLHPQASQVCAAPNIVAPGPTSTASGGRLALLCNPALC